MKTARMAVNILTMASLGGLTACTTYVEHREPPPVVYSQPPPVYTAPAPEPVSVEVVIRDERDFYEPLSPYGRWESMGNYGRCWVPAHVESGWRPYTEGHWERTDAGWYWVSDEPWGWATYHYGRWDFDPRIGWFWIPQTMWAPAWVTWHHGGGYIGWSPLPPSARIASSGVVEVNARAIPHRGYVFVEERRFLEPVRSTTVVNNTTIINQTVNITNVKVVNNTVINEGPRTQEIEQVSGHKLRSVPAQELRHKIETPVAAAHRPQPTGAGPQSPRQPAPAAAGATPPRPSRPDTDAERKAAEVDRQQKIEADRLAQEQQRKAQTEAEKARVESERKAKMEAEQRTREQARQAEAETARKKQEAQRQKQAQMEEVRLKQEADRKAKAEAQDAARHPQGSVENKKSETARDAHSQAQTNQPANGPKAVQAAPKAKGAKNQTEAERRALEQQKGNQKGKKTKESHPVQGGTNAPTPLTNAPALPPQ